MLSLKVVSEKNTVVYYVSSGRNCRRLSKGGLPLSEADARVDIERMRCIERRLEEACGQYTLGDVVAEYERFMKNFRLMDYIGQLACSLEQSGRLRTAETYRTASRSFGRFLASRGNEVSAFMLDRITSDIIQEYAKWLAEQGVSANTTSFYARVLRAVYNRGIEESGMVNRNPFRHVYTGVDKTVKRALGLEAVRAIREADLSKMPSLDYARDMFMLSFYLRGMSFIDMVYLRKSDVRCGSVIYRRRKTGQQLMIGWTAEMQAIVDKYGATDSEYLLPIVRRHCDDVRRVYRNVGYNINRNLGKLALLLGIGSGLTMYVARHTWASVARAKGVPVSVISEGLGHDNEATTRIYLANLDASVIDNANRLVMAL